MTAWFKCECLVDPRKWYKKKKTHSLGSPKSTPPGWTYCADWRKCTAALLHLDCVHGQVSRFGTGIKLPRNWACEKITEIYSVSRENGSLPIREFSFLFLWGEICNFKDHWTRMEKICDKRYRIYKRFQTQYVGQWPVHFEPPHTTFSSGSSHANIFYFQPDTG